MSEKSTLIEKLILFVIFIVFAFIVVLLPFKWNYVDEEDTYNSVVSFQYETVSKESNTEADEQISRARSSSSYNVVNENDSNNTSDNQTNSSNKININTATADELDTLPGIGEKKAAAIIEYRETKGLFRNIEDIKNVSGIGDGIFSKISEYITVE